MTGAGAAGRWRPAAVVTALSVLCSSVGLASAASAVAPVLLASARPDGTTGAGPSGTYGLSVSGDGAAVAFASSAPDLSVDDGDAEVDVYVKRLDTGQLVLASTSSLGVKAATFSLRPSLDGDGDTVAFMSAADNLHDADTDSLMDVFVKDVESRTLVLASVRQDGVKGDANSSSPSLSADGTRVAFTSAAPNLRPDDAGPGPAVFVKDLRSGELLVASQAPSGPVVPAGPYGIGQPSLSADGRHVAFDTDAALLAEDTDTAPDVYVKDLSTGALVLASTSAEGRNSARGSYRPSLSADGSRVAFDSFSADLSADDPSEDGDVFVKDLHSREVLLASSSSNGAGGQARATDAALSGDGRTVAFSSDEALDETATGGHLQTWVKELTGGAVVLVSTTQAGAAADALSISPRLSADGGTVAFTTPAVLAAQDDNGWADVYARRVVTPPPPEPDLQAPSLELAASPQQLPAADVVPVVITGRAVDHGSGVASVRIVVEDEYGTIAPLVTDVLGEGQASLTWTHTVTLSGRSRGSDPDGRDFTVRATATDVSGNISCAHVHVIAPPKRGVVALAGRRAPGRRAGKDHRGGRARADRRGPASPGAAGDGGQLT